MAILGYFLTSIAGILHIVLNFLSFMLIAKAILSWVSPDPYNPIVQFINMACEPIISQIRRFVPPLGMLDLSVLIALLLVFFLDNFFVGVINHYGLRLIASASSGLA